MQGPFLLQRASFIALPLVELLGVKEWVLRVSQSVRVRTLFAFSVARHLHSVLQDVARHLHSVLQDGHGLED